MDSFSPLSPADPHALTKLFLHRSTGTSWLLTVSVSASSSCKGLLFHCGFWANQKQSQVQGVERKEGTGVVMEISVGPCHHFQAESQGGPLSTSSQRKAICLLNLTPKSSTDPAFWLKGEHETHTQTYIYTYMKCEVLFLPLSSSEFLA